MNRASLGLCALFASGLLCIGAGLLEPAFQALPKIPSIEKVRADYHPSDVLVVDRNGEPLDEMRIATNGRRWPWISLAEVSPIVRQTMLASEDRHFESHAGVDWSALAAASWRNIWTSKKRGASTISMQVASLVGLVEPSRGNQRRTYIEKLRQIRAGAALERSWSKDQILEAYFNLVNFRGEIQGLATASRLLFKKKARGLNLDEASVLAALVRSPNSTWPSVRMRACAITHLVDPGHNCEGLQLTLAFVSERETHDLTSEALAPHFARKRVAALSPADLASHSTLSSTLRADLQKEALQLASEQLALLSKQSVHDAAVLVVDNARGEVLAYVGNVPDFSTARGIDGVQMRRQAGSTLKPFLYATAFEKNLLQPNSLLSDRPFEIDTGRGLYRPDNYDHRFRGDVTVREALASSMNIPAVRALTLVGPEEFVTTLTQLGFEHLNSGADYGDSLALGTADVSLWDLVRAYRVLATGGVYSDLRIDPATPPLKTNRVYSETTAARIADILSDREARSATFGLENPLATSFWTAVKTGTSKDMRDNWCVGFSSRYTVGVWVGNFNGDAMWDVSGTSGAAPIWVGLMSALHATEPSAVPQAIVDLPPEELLKPIAGRGFQRITQPAAGAVTVWDPDIPDSHQRILFEATTKSKKFKWRLDGKVLGSAASPVLWPPRPGAHHLTLLNANGHAEDEVQFSVRE